MKRSKLLPVLLASLLLPGCLVSSLHPFYKKSDKIYDQALNGAWIDSDSCIWVIEQNMRSEELFGPEIPDSTYRITYYEEKDGNSILQGTLFGLDNQRYVDFFPEPDEEHIRPEMTSLHHIPVHTLARVMFHHDTLVFLWFGEEWLNELFEDNRIRIDHEIVDYGNKYKANVLTAGTTDLQKFIRKYMNSREINSIIENALTKNTEVEDHVLLKLYPYDGPIPD